MVTAEALIDERERFFQELRNNKTRLIEIVRQMEQGSDVAIAARATVPREAVSEDPARVAYAR